MRFQKRAALAAPLLIATSASALAQQVSGNAFNPAVSLILDGHFASYSQDPKTYQIPGFMMAPDGGLGAEGLSLDETELAISSNVDDKYYGSMSLSIQQTSNGDTSVELEEAFFETTALPKGLKVKAVKFFSEIGYLNPVHSHAWTSTTRRSPTSRC